MIAKHGRAQLKPKPPLPDPFHPWRRPPPFLRLWKTFEDGIDTEELYDWLCVPGHGMELMSIPKIKEVKVRRLRKLRQRSASQ